MSPKMVWLFLLSLEIGLASIEYIINGNFDYPTLGPGQVRYGTATVGWNGSNFFIVNRLELGASNGQYIDVQNILGQTGYLSQTVRLPSSGNYTLSFLVKNNQNISSDHTLLVYFNSLAVLGCSNSDNQPKFFSFVVQGYIGLNQISFVQKGAQKVKGYYVDDVSLIGPQIYYFNCLKQIDFLKVQAFLQCRNSDNFSPLQTIFQNINITINNWSINYNVVSYQKETIIIQLLPQNQELVLNQINISVPSTIINQLVQPSPLILFLVEDLELSLVRIRSMYDSQFIVRIYSVSSVLMEKIKQLYSIFSTCVASYFLISIISFWNLALMFNTINISTMPPFAKAFLQKLTFIFFNLSSISEWIGIDMQTLNGLFDLKQVSGRQLMELKRNQNTWFGSFGISSKFFANNIQSIFVVSCSLMKFLMLFWLRKTKCLPDHLRKKLPIAKVVWKLFLLESISAQTFIVLSSITTILNSGFVDLKEKANFMIQSVAILLSFTVLYLYFFIAVEIRLRSSKQKNNNQFDSKVDIMKQHLSHKQIAWKSYLTELNTVLEFLPMIFVPFFIVFDSPIAILSVNLSFFILRFVWLIRKVSFLGLSIVEKVFNFCNVAFFILLCLIYFSLYVVQHLKSWPHVQIQGLELRIKQYCDTCGLLIIFVTLGGGIMQIAKHSILFIVLIVKRLQKLIQKIRKGKKSRTNKITMIMKAKKRTTGNDTKLKTKGTQSKKDIAKTATFSKTFVISNSRTNRNTTSKKNMLKIKNGDREGARSKKGIVFLQNS